MNEIDGRYRPQLSGPPVRDLRIALVASGPTEELQADHLQGFGHLLDACAVAGLRVSPQLAANGELPDADLLYVTGRADVAPEPALVDGLSERLRGGELALRRWLRGGQRFRRGPGLARLRGRGNRRARDRVARHGRALRLRRRA